MNQQFLRALTEIIRDEVAKKNEVAIDGLGVFKSEHRKQIQKQFDNGRVVMMPPKDEITFVPDKKLVYDNQ